MKKKDEGIEVKTFDTYKLSKLLSNCDSYVIEYIESLHRSIKMSEDTTEKAIKKIKELVREANDG